jgi:hypothetical protein
MTAYRVNAIGEGLSLGSKHQVYTAAVFSILRSISRDA